MQAGCLRPLAAVRREPGGTAAAPAPWCAWQWGLTVTRDARPGDVLAAVPAAAALFATDRAALVQQLAALRLRQLGLLPAAAPAPAAGNAAGGAGGRGGSPRAPAGGGGGSGACGRRGEDAEPAEAGAGAREEGGGAASAGACGGTADASGHAAYARGAPHDAGRAAGGDWAAAALAAHLAAVLPPPLALRLAGGSAEAGALREALAGAVPCVLQGGALIHADHRRCVRHVRSKQRTDGRRRSWETRSAGCMFRPVRHGPCHACWT